MFVPVGGAPFSGLTSAVTTTAGTATTYTGLVLANPLLSPVTVIPKQVSLGELVAQTAALTIGLMVGYSKTTNLTGLTGVTPATGYTGALSGASPIPPYATLSSAATLPSTPVPGLLLGTLLTGAITVLPNDGGVFSLVDGNGQPLFILSPGGYLAVYTSAAPVSASLSLGFSWTEQ